MDKVGKFLAGTNFWREQVTKKFKEKKSTHAILLF
jgi:hypothetical protein